MKTSIRIIRYSLLLFAIQLSLVIMFNARLQKGVVNIINSENSAIKVMRNVFMDSQQNALKVSKRALMSQKKDGFKVFWFGGSTAANYFYGEQWKKIFDPNVISLYNLAVATQSTYDMLRLVDNIKGPGIAILAIHPAKIFSHYDSQIVTGRYMTGQNYLFLLQSNAAEQFYHNNGPWKSKPTKRMRSFATLNPELAFFKRTLDLLPNKSNEFIGKYKMQLPVNPTSPPPKNNNYRVKLPGLTYEQRLEYLQRNKNYYLNNGKAKIELNLRILGEVESVLNSKGISLIVLEHPVGSMYIKEMKEIIDLYNSSLEKFLSVHQQIEAKKLEWQNFDGDEILFTDSVHLSEEGKVIFLPLLKKLIYSKLNSDN